MKGKNQVKMINIAKIFCTSVSDNQLRFQTPAISHPLILRGTEDNNKG